MKIIAAKAKFLIALLVCTFFVTTAAAQSTLTDDQKKMFQERVTQKVDEFQQFLKKIANKGIEPDVRKASVKSLLDLFIGSGEKYSYYDEELDLRITSTGVKIQDSSTRLNTVKMDRLKNYIYKFYNPETGKSKMPYEKIVIDACGAVRVDNIVRVGDHYECVAYFTQKFMGYRDGRVSYSDRTGKKIRVYIRENPLPTGKIIWEAFLGDIYVTKTTSL